MPKLNGALRLYNMFPRSFKNFDAMRDYIKEIAAMGFNAVWLNPLQEVSEEQIIRYEEGIFARKTIPIDDKVSGSLYASKDLQKLNKEFIDYSPNDSEEEIQRKGEEQLKKLVAEIKRCGMVPMFDLVLGHVAKDSDLVKSNPKLFKKTPSQYPDVIDFDYVNRRDEIVDLIWKPYIEKYIKEYGFEGVRVDAVSIFAHDQSEKVRETVYKILYEHVDNPIIFEELLISGDMSQVVKKLQIEGNYFPSYVTASLYYDDSAFLREEGSNERRISDNYKKEVAAKGEVVFVEPNRKIRFLENGGGVVNFSGSHDVFSTAGKVLRGYLEQIFVDPEFLLLKEAFLEVNSKLDYINGCNEKDLPNNKATLLREHDLALSKIFFAFEKAIIDNLDKYKPDFERKIKERMAICALVGGGGFFMTTGDESGDFKEAAVFAKRTDEAKLAKSSKRDEDFAKFIQIIATQKIDDKIEELLKRQQVNEDKLVTCGMREGFGENVSNEIAQLRKDNAKINKLIALAKIEKARIEAEYRADKTLQNAYDLESKEQDFCNFGADALSGKFDFREFIKEINGILEKMPAGQFCNWAEVLFLKDKPDLIIVARTNGLDFKIKDGEKPRSRCDLIILNIGRDPVELDLHDVYMDFEKKVGAPHDGSYNHIRKAELHLGAGIKLKGQERAEPSYYMDKVKIPSSALKLFVADPQGQSSSSSSLSSSVANNQGNLSPTSAAKNRDKGIHGSLAENNETTHGTKRETTL